MPLLRPALVLTVVFTVLTGLLYPLAMTGAARTLFPSGATGSLVTRDGALVGSALIGQGFANPAYLQPRPSASGWNAAGTGATNLGPASATLVADVTARAAAFEEANGAAAAIDAVTTSGSGLDPDVSPETALAQADRIAAARGADVALVREVIAAAVREPLLGLWGEAAVNVLAVNLALDEALGVPTLAPDGS
jgi:potassium-transporting ATPase KdpC subunit